MAITTFAELKTAILQWAKPNTTLTAGETALAATYVALCEAEINRRLNTPDMETTASLTITSGVATVPTGFRRAVKMSLTEEPYRDLTFYPVPPVAAASNYATGKPVWYTRSGSSFIFHPPSSSTASLRYRRGLTGLSADGDTNWLLDDHPDIYLFGSLMQADVRFMDGEQLQMATVRFETAITQLREQTILENAALLQVKPTTVVI